jgi:transcriptional regulator with GAF, ATPase, and Fis domain
LRERREDIPLLASYFATRFATRLGKSLDGIESKTMDRLTAYAWPGNIRELENIMERAVILTPGRVLEVSSEMLPVVAVTAADNFNSPPSTDLESVERDHILAVLSQTEWVIEGARGAAQKLGLHPNTLRSRMKKLGITRPAHELS